MHLLARPLIYACMDVEPSMSTNLRDLLIKKVYVCLSSQNHTEY